ncbi:hypothetical protein ACFV2S_15705 [Streptomyces sp. NPDC059695]|uniref:hypothetical protein n=1 Tax=Streptomyces sp. NPDC059695 TaxID=3346910 RepID=UPI0036A4049E
MSKVVGGFVAAGLAVGALVPAYAVGAPPGTVLAVGAGALGLLWLLLLLTAPWNLYAAAGQDFFLLSTAFRPAGAYFGQLRRRLGLLLREVTYPRDDVVALRERVAALEGGATVLDGKAEEQYRALAELRRTVDAVGLPAHGRADATDRRIAALAREFEATVNRLTDNEEIITGLKAFLRLLRSADGTTGPAAP